jgi:hypothetical protein
MAKGVSSKKTQPRRKINATQVVFIIISVIVILSFTLSLVAK